MAVILLLEDDETISYGICAGLRKKGHQVLCCESLEKARESFSPKVELALLDWNLPDGSGYRFCRELKEIRDIPVIFLTVRDDPQDIVRGLEAGADDYIVKPFLLSVLSARIQAVLRRSGAPAGAQGQGRSLSCGNICLDPLSARVLADGEEISLSAGEYRLLKLLMENKNQTLTRAMLLERLWDENGSFVNDNTLTVTMKRLREKLGGSDCIRTLRGIGYRMEDGI